MKCKPSDGCSGGMSWVWKNIFRQLPIWEQCCVDHDAAYCKGGSATQRLQADFALAKCVTNTHNLGWAVAMFLAVRIFGGPYWPFGWKWGFGVDEEKHKPS